MIFLSSTSINKPWVRTELKKALYNEIAGIKSDFIIPIKIDSISSLPLFLDSKYYIDIKNKTEEEWLNEIYRAVTSNVRPLDKIQDNLVVKIHTDLKQFPNFEPNELLLSFEARNWAEKIGFRVLTNEKIRKAFYAMPTLKGQHAVSVNQITKTPTEYAVQINNHNITPNNPFIIRFNFFNSENLRDKIKFVDRWDGSGSDRNEYHIINFQ